MNSDALVVPKRHDTENSRKDAAAALHESGMFREYALLIELKQLSSQDLSGVYVMPALNDIQTWHGVIFVRQGIYKGAIFRFQLSMPDNYPMSPPAAHFLSNVYHPLVDYDGHFDLSRAFPVWRPRQDHIWHVLSFMKKAFYHISMHQPLNEEACNLYLNEQEVFKAKVTACVKESQDNKYDAPDGCPITFSPWRNGIHDKARARILSLPNVRNGNDRDWGDELWVMAKRGFKRLWG